MSSAVELVHEQARAVESALADFERAVAKLQHHALQIRAEVAALNGKREGAFTGDDVLRRFAKDQAKSAERRHGVYQAPGTHELRKVTELSDAQPTFGQPDSAA